MKHNPVCGFYGCTIDHLHNLKLETLGRERKVCRNTLMDTMEKMETWGWPTELSDEQRKALRWPTINEALEDEREERL